jgi:hypothetical protein
MTETYVSVSLYLNDGTSRVFCADVTDGATYVELTDLLSGNSAGESMQGRVIVKSYGVCENFSTSPGGAIVVDQLGNAIGNLGLVHPESQTPNWEAVQIPIQLNYKIKVTTSASVA